LKLGLQIVVNRCHHFVEPSTQDNAFPAILGSDMVVIAARLIDDAAPIVPSS